MSPELYARKKYVPALADIFAAGYILFAMYSGSPPFECAKLDDYAYGLIMNRNLAGFWALSSAGRR